MKIFRKEKFLKERREEIGQEDCGEYKSKPFKVGETLISIFWKTKKQKFRKFELFEIKYGEWWRWILPFLLKKKIKREFDFNENWEFRARPNESKISRNGETIALRPKEYSFRFAEFDPIPFCLSESETLVEYLVHIITINFLDFQTFGCEYIFSLSISEDIQKKMFLEDMERVIMKVEEETKRVLKEVDNESRS